jgi:hypothetical protein
MRNAYYIALNVHKGTGISWNRRNCFWGERLPWLYAIARVLQKERAGVPRVQVIVRDSQENVSPVCLQTEVISQIKRTGWSIRPFRNYKTIGCGGCNAPNPPVWSFLSVLS